jgi:hypothetical protein
MFSASYVDIAIVGVVATAYMTFVHSILLRQNVAKNDIVSSIGAFIVPEPLRSRGLALVPHFFAGLFFAAVYSFLFDFMLVGRDLVAFVVGGAVIGLVQGYFLSFFALLGLSSVVIPSDDPNGDLRAALANIVLHVVYGAFVGFGFGTLAHTGTVLWFAVYGLSGLIVLKGLTALALPPESDLDPQLIKGLPKATPVAR